MRADHVFIAFGGALAQEPVPLYWQGMGEEVRRSEGYRWHGLRRDSRPFIIWQITLSGWGWVRDGKEPAVKVLPGWSFLAWVPSDHAYFFRRDPALSGWRFLWVIWSGPIVETAWHSTIRRSVRLVPTRDLGVEIRRLRELLAAYRRGGPDPWQNSREAAELLWPVLRAGQRAVEGPRVEGMAKAAGKVGPKLRRILGRSPASTVGKDGLAKALDISRFALYRRVKREAGVSPTEMRARMRLQRACALLRQPGLPVAEVGRRVGMPDANYFARFFRQRVGLSPRCWRAIYGR